MSQLPNFKQNGSKAERIWMSEILERLNDFKKLNFCIFRIMFLVIF